MAADATKIFGGAAVTIEISAAGADTWSDLGFSGLMPKSPGSLTPQRFPIRTKCR